jgi:hypothetical protein
LAITSFQENQSTNVIRCDDFDIRSMARIILSQNCFRISFQRELTGQDFTVVRDHHSSRDQ